MLDGLYRGDDIGRPYFRHGTLVIEIGVPKAAAKPKGNGRAKAKPAE